MWNLFIYGEKFTDTQAIAEQLAEEIGFAPVTDKDVINWGAQRFHMGYAKLLKTLIRKRSVFDSITHEKQRTMAYLRYVLAENIGEKSSIYIGLSGHLLPPDLPQVYRIFITADTAYRVQKANLDNHLSEKQALKEIQREDESAFRWCRRVYGNEAGDANTYHLVLPTHVLDRQNAVQMALENFRTYMQRPVPESLQAIEDFRLAARAEVLLAEKGYPVKVNAKAGKITVIVDKSVLFLSNLASKLTGLVKGVEGVEKVNIDVSPNFNQADLCCHTTYETSHKTQLNHYEERHARLRKRAIAAIPHNAMSADRNAVQSSLQLRTMG